MLGRRLTYFEELTRERRRNERAILRRAGRRPSMQRGIAWELVLVFYNVLRRLAEIGFSVGALLLIAVAVIPIWLVALPLLLWDLARGRLRLGADLPPRQARFGPR